jgi:quercetin dioxygenase-like cupin family protein
MGRCPLDAERSRVPVERSEEHPTFEVGTTKVTSFAAPSRGSDEVALFRIDVPPGGGLPAHHHDHHDVLTVLSGGGTFHIGDEAFGIEMGDSVVVPIGVVHFLEAGDEGATIVATMLGGTNLVRADDGSEVVPPWVG